MPVTLSHEDYLRLLDAAEGDDMLTRCETCDAWLDGDDSRAASIEDFEGCWFAAILREQDAAPAERPAAGAGADCRADRIARRTYPAVTSATISAFLTCEP